MARAAGVGVAGDAGDVGIPMAVDDHGARTHLDRARIAGGKGAGSDFAPVENRQACIGAHFDAARAAGAAGTGLTENAGAKPAVPALERDPAGAYSYGPGVARRKSAGGNCAPAEQPHVACCGYIDLPGIASAAGVGLARNASEEAAASAIDGDVAGVHFHRPGVARGKGSGRNYAAPDDRQVPRGGHLNGAGVTSAAPIGLTENSGSEFAGALTIDINAAGHHFYRPGIAQGKGAGGNHTTIDDRQAPGCRDPHITGSATTTGVGLARNARKIAAASVIDGDVAGVHFYRPGVARGIGARGYLAPIEH